LTLKVEHGGKEVSWKVKYRITNSELAEMFRDIADQLAPDAPGRPLRATLSPSQPSEVQEPTELSESASKALLAAKANSSRLNGGSWYTGNDSDELPFVKPLNAKDDD